MANSRCSLQDPFPTEFLATLDLGNMDGHRDSLIERGFIKTKSLTVFMNDKHSTIVGSFGTGKSAIFNLMKNKSEIFEKYKNDLMVTIDEQIQFDQLRIDALKLFPDLSDKLTYQLIWKFQTCRRICEELAKEVDFPQNKDEEYLSEFLSRTGGRGGNLSILSRLKELFDKVSFKLKTKLAEVPVNVEVGKEANKSVKKIEINLDQLLEKIIECISTRGYRQATVLIDKIDKFVAGEEYETQRNYIESLLQLEDDMYSYDGIGFKIFLRSDLYDRLDFTSLGPDKAEDNTLRLEWSRLEIQSFIAKRLYLSLFESGIWSFKEIIESSDVSDYSLRWYEKILIDEKKYGTKYKCAHFCNKLFGRKKNKKTLYEKIDLIIINKLFEGTLIHECIEGEEKQIDSQIFFATHFLDGNDSCTPRYMLVFLKELLDETGHYYQNSPDVHVTPVFVNGDWVYNLFSANLVYKAYVKSKEKFIRHVSKVDDKWTPHILELLAKKGNKTSIDFKWIKQNINFEKNNDNDALNLLIYLKVIGFLKEGKYDQNIKKRIFSLPILYSRDSGCIQVDT